MGRVLNSHLSRTTFYKANSNCTCRARLPSPIHHTLPLDGQFADPSRTAAPGDTSPSFQHGNTQPTTGSRCQATCGGRLQGGFHEITQERGILSFKLSFQPHVLKITWMHDAVSVLGAGGEGELGSQYTIRYHTLLQTISTEKIV